MTVASTSNRVDYTGNGSTTVFSFSFRIFDKADLVVTKADADGIETTLVLDTDYTVTGAGSFGGGSITLGTALPSGYALTIQRVLDITQETDLRNQGQFFAETHEDVFDRMVMIGQQLQEQIDRAAKLPITNTTDAEQLTADIVLLADNIDQLTSIYNALGDIETVADDLNEGTSEIETVAGAITNVNNVGNNIGNVNTVAGISGNVTTVAGIAANVTTVAGISTAVSGVAAISAAVSAVNSNATNINAVNANKTNIDTVAGVSADVTTVAGISGDVAAVENIAANVTTVAGIASNVSTVAGISSAVSTVASNNTNVSTVASNITSVNSAATNMSAIIAAPTQASNAASSASAAAASALAAAASAASGMYSAVQDKSADYTVVSGDAGDLIRVTTTGGARTITLPAISSVTDGFKIAIAKWSGDSNSVTVARSSSDLVNGATTYVLDAQYKSATFVADAETNTWFAAGTGGGGTNIIVDAFSGNGSTVAFTLSGDAGTENNTQVFVGGIYQEKDTYSLSGTTLTFSSAPPSGTSNIEVVWSTPLAIGTPSDGTVSTAKIADGALAATTEGLAKMADGFLQATIAGLAKMADGFLAATTAGRAKMADLFVTTAKLADAAVTTAKIADANVTSAKLASGAAVSNIGTGGITATQLASDAVTTVKILDANVTPAKLSQKLTLANAVNTTSGTAIDFTGIPSWVKRVTIMFDQVSTNGASLAKLQIGSSAGGFAASGYAAGAWTTFSSLGAQTTYFPLENITAGATMSRCGTVVLTNLNGNTWTLGGSLYSAAGPYMAELAGSCTISSTLDRIRITTVNGTDAFDAGSINILYEG